MDETQETLRTSAFPSNHVKVYIFASMIHPFSDPIFYSLLSLGQSNIGKKTGKMGEEPIYFLNVLWPNCVLTAMSKLQGEGTRVSSGG